MVYIISKKELFGLQYQPVMFKEEVAMMAIAPKGVIALFTDTDEARFIDWQEIVECTATAKAEKVPEPEAVEPHKKGTTREIKKPD